MHPGSMCEILIECHYIRTSLGIPGPFNQTIGKVFFSGFERSHGLPDDFNTLNDQLPDTSMGDRDLSLACHNRRVHSEALPYAYLIVRNMARQDLDFSQQVLFSCQSLKLFFDFQNPFFHPFRCGSPDMIPARDGTFQRETPGVPFRKMGRKRTQLLV